MDQFYKRLLDHTHDGVCRYVLASGEILHANRGFVELLELNCTPEELLGKPARTLFQYNRQAEAIREKLETGNELHDIEFNFRTNKGTDKWVLFDFFVTDEAQSNRRIVELFAKNITASKQLEKSEERFRRLAQNIEDVLYSVDVQTEEFNYFSPAFQRLLGYTLDDVRAMGGRRAFLSAVIQNNGFAEQEALLQKLKQQNVKDIPDRWEAWWRCKNGALRYMEDHWIPVYENGRLITTDGVLRDLTARKEAEVALRISEDKFRRMALHIEDVLYSVDAQTGEFSYFSPAFQRLLGYTLDDVRAMGGRRAFLSAVIQHDEFDRQQKLFERMKQQKIRDIPDRWESWWKCRNGQLVCLEDHWIPVYEGETLISTDGVLRDLTARKHAEEALHENEGRLHRLASSIDDVLYSVDGETQEFRYLSPAFERLMGYTAQDIRQMGGRRAFLTQVIQDNRFAEQDRMDDLRRERRPDNEPTRYETWWRCKNGEIKCIEDHWIPVYDGPRLISTEGVLRDITDRKRTDDLIRRNQERLNLALQSAGIGTFEWDILTDRRSWDDATHRMLGTSPESFTGTTSEFQQIVHPEDRAQVNAARSRALETGIYETEYRVIWPDGSVHFIAARGKVYRNSVGRAVRMLGVTWDVSAARRAEEAMRKSEQRFRALFDGASDAIFIHNLAGQILEVNQEACRQLGYTRDELLKMRKQDVDNPEYALLYADRMEQLERHGYLVYEVVHQRKDGSRVMVELNSRLIELDNQPTVLTICRDITQRKQTEEAMRASSYELSDLYNHAPCGYHSLDSDGRFVRINDTELSWLGYRREEVLGHNLAEFISPASQTAFQQTFPLLKVQGYIRDLEVELLRKDGATLPVMITATAPRDEKGDYVLSRSTVYDMSDRKRSEAALVKVQSEKEAILSGMKNVMVKYVDKDMSIIWASEAQAAEYGQPPEDLVGKCCYAARFNRPEPCPNCTCLKAIQSGVPEEGEITFPNGKSYMTRANPVRDAAGNILGAVHVSIDVTERLRLEQQLLQAQKMEAIGQLAGGVAHDFRNQLTVIKGFAEMMLRRKLIKDEGQEHFAEIMRATERSSMITNQLLAFSKKQVLLPKTVELPTLVADISKAIGRLIGEDIRLVTIPTSDRYHVEIDPAQFQQAIISLAINARDAMPNGGELAIRTNLMRSDAALRTRHPEATAPFYGVVVVSDTGQGMDEKTRGKIFEPFFTTKPMGQGTGLGLSVVYGLLQQSGGFIDVESEVGKGTTFRLYLPCKDEFAEGDIRRRLADLPRGTEHILVVEDDESVRRIVVTVLQDCGYTVMETIQPEEALALAQSDKRIDMVLTDVVMPRIGGAELERKISEIRPNIPVLFVSGYTGADLVRRGINTARMALLNKPFSQQELAQAVRRVLEKGKAPA